MTIRALLWDFGDTLADERWMQAPMDGVPRWPAVWRSRMGDGDLAQRWDLGQITSAEVAAELGRALGVPADTVLVHMRACCRDITFLPTVMGVVHRCPLPQAIVTINPDIFSEAVAPAYRLAERFAAIVTSWEAGSASKADLCDLAMARLGGGLARGECLLIDNKADNIAEWIARGGAGYHFQGAAALTHDLSSRFDIRLGAIPAARERP